MLTPVRLSINPSFATPKVTFSFRWRVNKYFFLIALTATLSLADFVKAESADAQNTLLTTNPQQLPTVMVTASRISADDIDTDFQTGHVTVISRDKFEGEVATVADILGK
jgi:hypothetical protein